MLSLFSTSCSRPTSASARTAGATVRAAVTTARATVRTTTRTTVRTTTGKRAVRTTTTGGRRARTTGRTVITFVTKIVFILDIATGRSRTNCVIPIRGRNLLAQVKCLSPMLRGSSALFSDWRRRSSYILSFRVLKQVDFCVHSLPPVQGLHFS